MYLDSEIPFFVASYENVMSACANSQFSIIVVAGRAKESSGQEVYKPWAMHKRARLVARNHWRTNRAGNRQRARCSSVGNLHAAATERFADARDQLRLGGWRAYRAVSAGYGRFASGQHRTVPSGGDRHHQVIRRPAREGTRAMSGLVRRPKRDEYHPKRRRREQAGAGRREQGRGRSTEQEQEQEPEQGGWSACTNVPCFHRHFPFAIFHLNFPFAIFHLPFSLHSGDLSLA